MLPQPRVELLPLRAALPAGQASDLTVLARIHPVPISEGPAVRPPLNLSLVLDRSGSMSGDPLRMARLAAQTAIRAMLPQDRVSVVLFDNSVETLLPPQHVTDPEGLCREVERITAGGSTALHAGWLEGATLTAQHLDRQALNRVLLLSDGQANHGERRPHVIAEHVRGLTGHGVSTSTVGLGRSYNEDLMRAMADAGDGNFEHIEDPAQLPAFFESELQGFSRTSGHTVSLGIEPNPQLQVARVEVLNDLTRNELGRWQLPNLISGRPIDIVLTLHVPGQERTNDVGVTRVRLAWTGRDGIRRKTRVQLNLPVLQQEAYSALPEKEEVQAAQHLLENARAKRDAVAYMDRGDVASAREVLSSRRALFAAIPSAMPSPLRQGELDDLDRILDSAEHDAGLARKRAVSQNYNRSRSK